MAAVISNLSPVSLPSQLSNLRRFFFKPCARPRLFDKRIFAVKIRASSTAFVDTKPPTVTKFLSSLSNSSILNVSVCLPRKWKKFKKWMVEVNWRPCLAVCLNDTNRRLLDSLEPNRVNNLLTALNCNYNCTNKKKYHTNMTIKFLKIFCF